MGQPHVGHYGMQLEKGFNNMKKLLILAGLFFLPWAAHAATITQYGTMVITISSGTASATSLAITSTTYSGDNTTTWSMDCKGGNLLVVAYVKPSNTRVTGITYNGVALSYSTETYNTGNSMAGVWYLASPATGSNSIVVSPSGGNFNGGAVCLTGSKISSPIDSASCSTAGGGSGTLGVTWSTTNSGDWLIDAGFSNNGNAMSASGGQTAFWTNTGGVDAYASGAGSTKGPVSSGSQTMSWTATSFAQPSICAVAVNQGP